MALASTAGTLPSLDGQSLTFKLTRTIIASVLDHAESISCRFQRCLAKIGAMPGLVQWLPPQGRAIGERMVASANLAVEFRTTRSMA
jgi:hypothetical protein